MDWQSSHKQQRRSQQKRSIVSIIPRAYSQLEARIWQGDFTAKEIFSCIQSGIKPPRRLISFPRKIRGLVFVSRNSKF